MIIACGEKIEVTSEVQLSFRAADGRLAPGCVRGARKLQLKKVRKLNKIEVTKSKIKLSTI